MAAAPYRKTMLGMQADSKLPSAPSYGFGTEERPEPASLDKAGRTSPGPVYKPTSHAGGLRTAPSHSFGVSHRYSLGDQKLAVSPVPGPGQYQATDAVGRQSDSQKHSYSTWKFGSSTRTDQAKVFMSAEHAKSVPEYIQSPGPAAYNHGGSLGSQHDSRRPTNESYGMGTADRFFYDKKLAGSARGVPQCDSVDAESPLAAHATTKLDREAMRSTSVPGPGTYMLQSATGTQASSLKQSYPKNSFPKADRTRTAEKQYVSKKLSTGWGKASPGPAVYSLTDSVGNQVSSVKKNCPQFGFGTADRFAYQGLVAKASQSPGPGSYSL